MAASSLRHHMERSHVIVLPYNRRVDIDRERPETCMVYFTWVLKLVALPVDV